MNLRLLFCSYLYKGESRKTVRRILGEIGFWKDADCSMGSPANFVPQPDALRDRHSLRHGPEETAQVLIAWSGSRLKHQPGPLMGEP